MAATTSYLQALERVTHTEAGRFVPRRIFSERLEQPPNHALCGNHQERASEPPVLIVQRLFIDLAILDDHAQILELTDDLDVLQRIAIDQQQISKRTFLDNAEVAGIGVPNACPSQIF